MDQFPCSRLRVTYLAREVGAVLHTRRRGSATLGNVPALTQQRSATIQGLARLPSPHFQTQGRTCLQRAQSRGPPVLSPVLSPDPGASQGLQAKGSQS